MTREQYEALKALILAMIKEQSSTDVEETLSRMNADTLAKRLLVVEDDGR